MSTLEPTVESAAPVIRKAALQDLEAVVELRMAMLEELAGSDPSATPAATGAERDAVRTVNLTYTREHLGRDLEVWVADVAGMLVASAGIIWFEFPPSFKNPTGLEAYILNVYTRPDWRRRGIARALMEKVLEVVGESDTTRTWLRASEHGRPLYESLGFGPHNYMQLHVEPRE